VPVINASTRWTRSVTSCDFDVPHAAGPVARESASVYGKALKEKGLGAITTEIAEAGPFYFAEGYHQQYLAKNPGGYCGLGGTGVSCPIGLGVAAE